MTDPILDPSWVRGFDVSLDVCQGSLEGLRQMAALF